MAAVDVRGGGPGTRETDALDPRNLVQRIDAVVLTGGSAYGLDAASGVMAWLEEQGRGVRVGPDPSQVVPVVPAACLFDLGRGGDWRARPDASTGRAAVEAAAASAPGAQVPAGLGGRRYGSGGRAAQGRRRHGERAPALRGHGRRAGRRQRGGLRRRSGDRGAVRGVRGGRASGAPRVGGARGRAPAAGRDRGAREAGRERPAAPLNTTLAVVATDAALTRAQAQKLAGTAHDGLARAVRPVHLLTDGDTVFALSTGRLPLPPEPVAALNDILAAGGGHPGPRHREGRQGRSGRRRPRGHVPLVQRALRRILRRPGTSCVPSRTTGELSACAVRFSRTPVTMSDPGTTLCTHRVTRGNGLETAP